MGAAGSWTGQRVHQYEAQTTVASGGVALTVDRNFMSSRWLARPRPTRAAGHSPRLRNLSPVETGQSGDRVKALQCLLKKNARDHGRLDARFDRDVAEQCGLSSAASTCETRAMRTSIPGPRWSPRFGAAAEGRLCGRARPSPGAGPARRRVQVGEGTGVVTERTAAAVRRHQQGLGLDPTGVVTADLWAALQRGAR